MSLDREQLPARWFTVLLLRPDYIADNFGQDSYTAYTKACDATQALRIARETAMKVDGRDSSDADMTDYFCIAIYDGRLNDLNPE